MQGGTKIARAGRACPGPVYHRPRHKKTVFYAALDCFELQIGAVALFFDLFVGQGEHARDLDIGVAADIAQVEQPFFPVVQAVHVRKQPFPLQRGAQGLTGAVFGGFLHALPAQVLPVQVQRLFVGDRDEVAFQRAAAVVELPPVQAEIRQRGIHALVNVLGGVEVAGADAPQQAAVLRHQGLRRGFGVPLE